MTATDTRDPSRPPAQQITMPATKKQQQYITTHIIHREQSHIQPVSYAVALHCTALDLMFRGDEHVVHGDVAVNGRRRARAADRPPRPTPSCAADTAVRAAR